MPPALKKADPLLATRKSLVARLSDWGDRAKWQEFFETYWELIYNVALRAGLRDDEAQEAVQETCIAVAKNVVHYDSKDGSFKAWLLHTARWRIADQFRKRTRQRVRRRDDDTRETATLDRFPAEGQTTFESAWEEEWKRRAFDMALANVKHRVDAKHFQIFDCVAVKGWTPAKTAKELRVNIAQVYLVKHRLMALLKKELAALE